MAYNPLTIGQQPMSSSQGVVIASNQSPVSVAGTLNIIGNPSISGTVGASVLGVVPIGDGTNNISIGSGFPGADGAAVGNGLRVAPYNMVYNGSNWDRQRGNSSVGTIVNTSAGSVITLNQGSIATVIIGGSIAASFTPPANQSVSGTVVVNQGTTPWIISSVYGNVSGSIVSFQSGTWNVSVLSTVPSSLLTGIYSQRNDAISSFLGGNLTWNPISTDSAGRVLSKPFVSEDATIISYVGSIVSGSIQLIQASAIGKRNYITDFWLSNTGTATTLVTFQGGDTSVVGQFIAPTGGGMSSPGIAVPLKTTLSQDLAFKVSTATSVLYLVAKGYQAP